MSEMRTGWKLATLGELASPDQRSITDGPFGSNLTSAHYTATGPRVIRLQNIGDGRFIDNPAHISEDHFNNLRTHEALAGDLIVASLGQDLPRACLVPTWLGPAIVKADCIRVRLGEHVDPRWALYAMQTPNARQWAAEQLHGVGRPRLGLKVIRAIPVPMPPIEEQCRIVDVLEDHLSRLDAASANLRAVKARQRGLIASVLAAQACDAPTVLLNSLEVKASYGTSTKCIAGGPGPAVARIPNIVSGEVDMSDEKRVADPSVDVGAYMLEENDLLIVRTNGSRDLIGRSAVVQSGVNAAFASYLIRYRVNTDQVMPQWVNAMLAAPQLRALIERLAASSAGQYNLSLGKLSSLPIPTPPISEQARRLRIIEAQSDAAMRLESAIDRAELRSQALRRGLLQAAFSGRLSADDSILHSAEEAIA